MIINLAATANPLEWAYSLCALVTLLITIVLGIQTQADRRIQREATERDGRMRNRIALRIAGGQVEDITYMALVQVCILTMGVDAMLTQPANRSGTISALAWVFGVGLIAADLLCFIKAFRAYQRRRGTLQEIEESLTHWDGAERRDSHTALHAIPTSALKAELERREKGGKQ